jgi:hypothetical protein
MGKFRDDNGAALTTVVDVTADQHPHQADVATPVPLLATARHRPATLSLADCPMWRAPIVALERLWGQAACAGVGWGLGSGSGIGRTGVGAPVRLAGGWVWWPGWLVVPLSQ